MPPRSSAALLGLSLALVSRADGQGMYTFYPEGHFDRVLNFEDADMFQQHMDKTIPEGKATFAPSWNDVTSLFQGNEDIHFGDVNLAVTPDFRGEPHNPGDGGWPTIRYFNEKTGSNGGAYNKLTNEPMCAELEDRNNMIDYIEDYGNTVLCDPFTGRNCNEKELKYTEKYKIRTILEQQTALDRLNVMISNPMKDDLRLWAIRRIRVLKRLLTAADTEAPDL